MLSRRFQVSDEAAYAVPFAVFMILVLAGSQWPSLYPVFYAARTVLVAGLLALFWRHYTTIRWTHLTLAIIVGIIGVFQWVGMQLWLQTHFDHFKPLPDFFNPERTFSSPLMLHAFLAVRILGAALVVPVMEELFWRDYLWRTIAARRFKNAPIGEWDLRAFLLVAILFATAHGNWWLTSIVWAMMIGSLLTYTKSLGPCIVAHSVTNLLLAVYVVRTGNWSFW